MFLMKGKKMKRKCNKIDKNDELNRKELKKNGRKDDKNSKKIEGSRKENKIMRFVQIGYFWELYT